MARPLCLFLATLGSLIGASAHRTSRSSALIRTSQGGTEVGEVSPVKRVVALLNKMQEELRAEADNEAAMYDKMVCWCETNEKQKTQAIADAEAKDLELTSEIESRSARFGNLNTEIEASKAQIAVDTESLKEATAIREKTAAGFTDEEKDLVQAIDNLRNAIAVLSKHHGGSLLQLDAPLVSGLRVVLRDAAVRYGALGAVGAARRGHPSVAGLLQTLARGGARSEERAEERAEDEGLRRLLWGALDAQGSSVPSALPLAMAERLVAQSAHARPGPPSSFLQAGARAPIDAAYSSYSARSGGILGVMSQMLEEFEAQLSSAQKEDLKSIEDYKALAKAKKEQITTGKEKLDDLEGDNAANQKALSDAKEDLGLTRKQRSADVEFLRKLKLTCNDLDKEWERRSATRSEEGKAVAEAISILTADGSRETLARSVSLLQERASSRRSAAAALRARAAEALRRSATAPAFEADDLLASWHSRRGAPAVGSAGGPRAGLSALATAVQLDSFEKVKEMMDTMVAELKAQQKEEAEFKGYCTKELNENEKATYAKKERKGDLESNLASLASLMTKLEKEIAEAKKQILETELEMKKASENREAENKEFQQTVSDQRATQAILKKALQRLQDFYLKGKGKKVIYLQRDSQTPPVQFTKYKANAGSSPVIGLLENIIEDSVTLEKEATAGEYKAQADYEQFTKDSNALIADLSDAVATKTKAVADAKLETAETQSDLKSTVSELESLAAYEADLHGQCDFVLKNFEIRQKARLQEMEAIQAAKGILAGSQE